MNNPIEYYLQQLNSPATAIIRNIICSCQELSGSKMTVKPLTINGMSSSYLCCVFRHPCVYRGNTYIIPMELIIPQFFPRSMPSLYIRPDRGSRIVPIPNIVDVSGCVIFHMVNNLCYQAPMNQILYELDRNFARMFPICVDTKTKLVDDCSEIIKKEFIELYNSYAEKNSSLDNMMKDIQSTESAIQTQIPTVQKSIEEMEKQRMELTKVREQLNSLEEKLHVRSPLNTDYANAFAFKDSSQRLLFELEALERSCTELNDNLVLCLSKTNMEEIIDIIRENAKQLFEAQYLKQVVKAHIDSSIA